VVAADDALLAPLKVLAPAMGPDSMIVRLAVGQHSRLVGAALDSGRGGFALGEALFQQHIRLQVGALGRRVLILRGGRVGICWVCAG
jgi:hypothetical protein